MRSSLVSLSLGLPLAMLACSGAPAADESVETTHEALSASDSAAILAFVNDPGTTETVLDAKVKLDARAARDIVNARNGADGVYPSADDAPFATLAELDAISYVGPSALTKLKTYALAHPAPKGEVVEGVTFSGWQSEAVVWGVDHSTRAELDAFLDSRAATSLVEGVPYTTVAQMGPKSYVGERALTALRGQAVAWWNASRAAAGSSCITAFTTAVTPDLSQLLFMSESDRPFDVVAYPGAGAAAPTAASVLALVAAPAGSTSQLRAVGDFDVAFEPSGAGASPGATAAVEGIFASQLKNVVYVAVFAPPGSVDTSLVDVYLVGTTTCGDLVGIHAIAVET